MRTQPLALAFLRAALAGVLALSGTEGAAGSNSVTNTVTTIEYADDWADEAAFTPALPAAPARAASVGDYGPFRVVSDTRADMDGVVGSDTPAHFATMLRDHPDIRSIEMIECPGSDDEEANLRLALMVRKAGISTHVPAGGSVRSGAVELWLAGVHRSADEGAEFAVHSWRDETGLEADDAAADNPVHREYLDYYAAMGIPAARARAFYALTNSVGYDEALYLAPRDMAAMGLIDASSANHR